jgi:hypothetical protein
MVMETHSAMAAALGPSSLSFLGDSQSVDSQQDVVIGQGSENPHGNFRAVLTPPLDSPGFLGRIPSTLLPAPCIQLATKSDRFYGLNISNGVPSFSSPAAMNILQDLTVCYLE